MILIAQDCGADAVTYQLMSAHGAIKGFDAQTASTNMEQAFYLADQLRIDTYQYPVRSFDISIYNAWFSSVESVIKKPNEKCRYIHKNIRIDPVGNILPCIEYNMGNILKDELSDIWRGKKYERFRNEYALNGPFKACLRCCNSI